MSYANRLATRLLTLALALALGLGLVAACGEGPGQAYDDFLARADRTPPELRGGDTEGVLTDVTGDFLYNIALKPLGDVYLELRCTFTSYELNDDGTEAEVEGEFRFVDEDLDDPPLASFETILDEIGQMTIDVGHVRIEADRSPIEDTAVEVDFRLDVIVLNELEQCGVISDPESIVTAPINLQLVGTTFGGLRYGDQGQVPANVPTECPFEGGGGDDAGGDTGFGDMGPDVPDLVDPLQPPDVDLGDGVRADISGRFWMKAALAGSGLALDFIVDFQYFESADSASVDGALRSVEADPADPALAQFSEPVDDNGEFTVVIPDLTTDSALGPVSADIALRAIILDVDSLCGAADGEVRSPLEVDLEGTTFGAVRMEPGATEEPEGAIDACPE